MHLVGHCVCSGQGSQSCAQHCLRLQPCTCPLPAFLSVKGESLRSKQQGDLVLLVLVFQEAYDPAVDHIVTAASCTTNCIAPVVKVVLDNLGIVHGCITTCHNITNTQTVLDAPNSKKSDLRRARCEEGIALGPPKVATICSPVKVMHCVLCRSGLVNLAPTSTGSATAIALIYPELKVHTVPTLQAGVL